MGEHLCACTSVEARNCYRIRYGLDLREMFGDGIDSCEAEEECSCSCHDTDEDDDDWEAA